MHSWLTPLGKAAKPERRYTLIHGERRSDPEKRRKQMREAMVRYRARQKLRRSM